jgi:hypothetical protein
MRELSRGTRLAVIGDAAAEGLSVKGNSYSDLLRAQLEENGSQTTLLNLAYTGYQASDSSKLLQEVVAFDPSIIIIAHGITEALIRPKQEAMRLIPSRWRQVGWLDPRPYFSRRLWKSVYHRSESGIGWRVKVYLIKKYGGCTLTSVEDFEQMLANIVSTLLQETKATIILLTYNGTDERIILIRFLPCNAIKSALHRSLRIAI